MGHQRAAFEVLTQLFTAQTAMQTPAGRVALMWYSRFDVFLGIVGSAEPSLPRAWFSAPVEYYETRAAAEPHNVSLKIEACAARLRLTSMEMSLLYSKGANQNILEDEYMAEHRRLSAVIDGWRDSWDPALTGAAFLVADFPASQSPDPDEAASPFVPGVLFRPPLFAASILAAEYHAIALMHGSQSARALTDDARVALAERAHAICQTVEAVERWPHSPAGSLVVLHSCLAIAALYVRRDPPHRMWIRRKFALLETMG